MIRVERFSDARSFVTNAREFLLSREAHHNLILGILWTLTHQPEQFEHTPYLAQVLEERRVVAAAVMTPPKNLVLSLAPDEAALRLIAEDLFTDRTDLPGVLGPEAESEAFARCWGLISGQSVRQGMAQLIHQLEAVTPISEASGELRRATGQERDLLVQWMNEFTGEALNERDPGQADRAVDMHLKRKSLYLWWHGRPVSMAGWAGPTANGIRVTAVYTPPEFRRRGYAGACVAALSQSLLDGGYRYCFLFTDKSNPTSNHIYRDICLCQPKMEPPCSSKRSPGTPEADSLGLVVWGLPRRAPSWLGSPDHDGFTSPSGEDGSADLGGIRRRLSLRR